MLWTSSQAFSFQLNLKLYCTSHLIGPSDGRIQYPCWKSARLLHTVLLNVERTYFWGIITSSNIWKVVRLFNFLPFLKFWSNSLKVLTFISPSDKLVYQTVSPFLGLLFVNRCWDLYMPHQPFFPQDDRQTYSINVLKTKNIFWMQPSASHWMSCSKGNGSLIYHEDWDKNSRNLSGAMPIV